MNTNFNKAVKGKARTGMSVVPNKPPFIEIICF